MERRCQRIRCQHWMWSRRERGPCLDVARVLGTREGDRRVDVCCDRLQRDIPRFMKCNRGSELFVTCILVQRHEATSQEGCEEIPPLFEHSHQFFVCTRCPFAFRADTLCRLFPCTNCSAVWNVWERSFELTSCVDAQTLCSIQTRLVLILCLTRPCTFCRMAQAILSEDRPPDSSALSHSSFHENCMDTDCAWTPSSIRVLCNRTSTVSDIGQSDNHFQRKEKKKDGWNSDNCFLEPLEAVTRMKHKSLEERTKLDTTLCQEGMSGSLRSRAQCPCLCCQSTLPSGKWLTTLKHFSWLQTLAPAPLITLSTETSAPSAHGCDH